MWWWLVLFFLLRTSAFVFPRRILSIGEVRTAIFPPRNDTSPLDKMAIYLLSSKLYHSDKTQQTSQSPYYGMNYQDFVETTKPLLTGTKYEIHNRVLTILRSCIPARIRPIIFAFSQKHQRWICKTSATVMRWGFFDWLVGRSSIYSISVADNRNVSVPNNRNESKENTLEEEWKRIYEYFRNDSPVFVGVKIEKCKYLTESNNKMACQYLCKKPTQQFFQEDIGIHLTMVPDYTDNSCRMEFGVKSHEKTPQKPNLTTTIDK
jgi:hypothetical protein